MLFFFCTLHCRPWSSQTKEFPTELTVTSHHSMVLFTLLDVLSHHGKLPTTGWLADLLYMLQKWPVFILTPRFIISVREMYARDVQSSGGGIDTGFGLFSSSRDADYTEIAFADYGPNETLDEGITGGSSDDSEFVGTDGYEAGPDTPYVLALPTLVSN